MASKRWQIVRVSIVDSVEDLAHWIQAAKGQNNLAFAALLQTGEPSGCVDLLLNTGRPSEATLFSRTYAPRLACCSH
jgi:coatomer subunit beta'